MFCIACGKQIADDSLFCEHCGAKQEGAVQHPTAVPPPVPPAPAQGSGVQTAPPSGAAPVGTAPAGPAPIDSAPVGTAPIGSVPIGGAAKKPMSPKTKTALIAAAAAAVVLVGIKLVCGALFTPEKTIDKFLTAYQSGDADAFRAAAAVAEDQMELTDEALLPFLSAYKGIEKDAFLSDLRETLMHDALYLKQGVPAEGDGFVRLTEKSYVLFSTYAVEITPLNVVITSEFEGTDVAVGGTHYTTGSEEARAAMLPGVYAVTASYTVPATGVTLEYSAPEYSIPRYNPYIDIYFDYTYTYIESSIPMTLKEIQVDGKTYTGDLSGMDLYTGFSIGPVNYDSKIKVMTEALGLEFEQEFDLKENGDYCYITPELSQELEQEAINTAAAVLPDWLRSSYNYDREALKRLSDAGSLSPYFLDDLDSQISYMWDSAEDVYYIQFDQIDVQKSKASVYYNIDPILYANVEIPVTISGVRGYMSLATGEFKESFYPIEGSEEFFNVSLIYQDGKWTVDGLYWY